MRHVETNDETDENIYFNPKLNDLFRKEINRIPLWSAAMKSFFRSPKNP